MNAPVDTRLLEQLLFNQERALAQQEQTLWLWKWFGGDVALALDICLAVALGVLLAVILLYRPCLRRGSLWLPAFGLFGGRPTLYYHTRPSSWCGLFPSSRRRRSRV